MTLVTSNKNSVPSFSHLFDDFFNTELNDWRRNNYSASNTTLPKVNIMEDDDKFMVEMAAPGMQKKDFNLNLDQNVLTISAVKETDKKDDNIKYTKREFAYQSFQRSFTLPDIVNGE